MPNSSANVTVGKPKISGAVFRAPIGTALPTDASSTLAEAFVALGYVSEDGVTNSAGGDSDVIKAWGGDDVYAVHTDFSDTFNLTFIEAMNINVLKAYYGDDNVTGALSTGITVTVNSNDPDNYVWVVDMVLRGGGAKRIVIPNGAIAERGDIVYVDNDPVGYEVTIRAMPDATGNNHYEYLVLSE